MRVSLTGYHGFCFFCWWLTNYAVILGCECNHPFCRCEPLSLKDVVKMLDRSDRCLSLRAGSSLVGRMSGCTVKKEELRFGRCELLSSKNVCVSWSSRCRQPRVATVGKHSPTNDGLGSMWSRCWIDVMGVFLSGRCVGRSHVRPYFFKKKKELTMVTVLRWHQEEFFRKLTTLITYAVFVHCCVAECLYDRPYVSCVRHVLCQLCEAM